MPYCDKEIKHVRQRVQDMFSIVCELERTFPGRKFTLDGHLIGSIGEVLATYYYDLELLTASTEKHDAKARDGRMVQIKVTQGMRKIAMRSKPEHLLVLWIDDNTGEAREVYNGPGAPVWEGCGGFASNGTRSITILKLKNLSAAVPVSLKLQPINPIVSL